MLIPIEKPGHKCSEPRVSIARSPFLGIGRKLLSFEDSYNESTVRASKIPSFSIAEIGTRSIGPGRFTKGIS